MRISTPLFPVFIFAALALLIAATPVAAQEAQPGDACTTAGAFVRSGGPEIAGGHMLVCDSANWITFLDYADTGKTLFQVDNDNTPCTATKQGRLRYASAGDNWDYCDGAAWQTFGSGGASAFTNLTDTPANYTGAADQFVKVNSTPDGLVFSTAALDDLTDAAKNLTDNNLFIAHEGGSVGATDDANTGIGIGALDALNNTDSDWNTAVGYQALTANTSGDSNTAIGYEALLKNTAGPSNTAIGRRALLNNTTGTQNTATGVNALSENTTGWGNTGYGYYTLWNNTTGEHNTVIGHQAGGNFIAPNGDMDGNALFGYRAGYNLEGGATEGTGANYNILLGYQAGDTISTGDQNIIIGYLADVPFATTTQYINIGDIFYGSMGTGELFIGSNGALAVPVGDDAQRPGTLAGTAAAKGMIRYNSSSNVVEAYIDDGSPAWETFSTGGGTLAGLSDTTISGPVDGEVLTYSAGSWVNGGGGVFELNAGVVRNTGDHGTEDFVFGSPQLDDDADPNHDSRMFFDKSNSAFRAGLATGNQWNFTSSGLYSVAFGNNTVASGLASTAMGQAATAAGGYSMAMGYITTASGDWSTATGNTTIASGDWSTAMGYTAIASGLASTAMGRNTIASGDYSTAMGGGHTTAAGDYSTTMGREVTVTATGDGSMGIGLIRVNTSLKPQVSGPNALGIFMGGQDGGVDFASSNAFGVFGITNGMVLDPAIPATQLTARGILDLGAAADALVLPGGTDAQRPGTPVGGMLRYNTTATPNDSLEYYDAEGTAWTTVLTTETDPEVGTLTASKWCTTDGSVVNCTTDTPVLTETDPEVGTLTASKWCTTDGSVVNCTTDTPTTGPAGANTQIQFNSGGTEFGASTNLVWDGAKIVVTGDIHYSGITRDTSDIRLKTDIRPLEGSLAKLTSLEPIAFRMKGAPEGVIEYGFSAQDVARVFPALVFTEDDAMGTMSLNYIGLMAPMIEAIKQQQTEIDDLRATNRHLRTRLNRIEAYLSAIRQPDPVEQ